MIGSSDFSLPCISNVKSPGPPLRLKLDSVHSVRHPTKKNAEKIKQVQLLEPKLLRVSALA